MWTWQLATRVAAASPCRRPRPVDVATCDLLRRGEGEQDVACGTAIPRVAGVDEQHAVGDDGTRAIDGAAGGLDAVDRRELTHRVDVPHHRSVAGRVGAEVTVERA